MRCECGCGFEGEDAVMQFLLEEALHERLDCERLLPELRRARAAELTDAVEEAKAAALAGLEER